MVFRCARGAAAIHKNASRDSGGRGCDEKTLLPLLLQIDHPMAIQKIWTVAHRYPVKGGWRDPFQGETAILDPNFPALFAVTPLS